MKKKLVLLLVICCLCLVGCGKNSEKNVLKKIDKKINAADAYHLEGTLEIKNNEDTFMYDLDVSYQKDDKFRVSLKNQNNSHEQIILRNDDGVYVLTPSLNKSFKFQSEWPYNNSQAYLLQTILKDLKDDSDLKTDFQDKYKFYSKVNYSNNKDLVKQEVIFDKDLNLEQVNIMDQNDEIKMKVNFKKIDLKASYKKDYFDLKTNVEANYEVESFTPVSAIESMIYPMYIPANTYLISQDKIKDNGTERVIMTFGGDRSFTLIQETIGLSEEFVTLPVEGDPYLIADSVAAKTDSTMTWYSNGVEYFLASENLEEQELISVAKSISVLPVGK